jgi:hypothetical protein
MKTKEHRPLLIVSAFLLASLIAGCGDKSGAQSEDGDDPFEQALAYSQCMRSNGVPDFPDPQRDGDKVKKNVGNDKDSPTMKKAMEACRDKLSQGEADGPDAGSVDQAKLVDWMKCMRGKLPNFPDAQVSGGTITLNLKGTGIDGDSEGFKSAQRACQSDFPGGSLNAVNE